MNIEFSNEEALDGMRKAGRLASQTLDFIEPHVVPGITTGELDQLVHEFTLDHGAIPAPLNYNGFPKSCCTSVNHIVCHGIPGNKRLREGDIINIDVTPILDGWYGDTSRMFSLGNISVKARNLIAFTHDAMMEGIKAIKPHGCVGDIGFAIQNFVGNQYGIVREYCGHGLGREFHIDPQVPHFGIRGGGALLKPGMFITVEPMLNVGKPGTKVLSDGWTVVTRDKSLSAQWEHSIAITEDGYEILTVSD
jgi:methionyl aminopeptidase